MVISDLRERGVVIEVRAEVQGDEGPVDAILEAAFGGRRVEPDLVAILRREASPTLSRVAVVEGEVIGHVFVSPGAIRGCGAAPSVAGVGPLGVHPKRQGQGVGRALMQEAIEAARSLSWEALFLLGNSAYYSRFGFQLAAPRGIRYKNDDRNFQVRELVAGSLEGVEGEFVYHEAFERFDSD